MVPHESKTGSHPFWVIANIPTDTGQKERKKLHNKFSKLAVRYNTLQNLQTLNPLNVQVVSNHQICHMTHKLMTKTYKCHTNLQKYDKLRCFAEKCFHRNHISILTKFFSVLAQHCARLCKVVQLSQVNKCGNQTNYV